MFYPVLQAAAEYVTTVGNSAFWAQLKQAPSETMDFMVDHPWMMAVVVVAVMLVVSFSKHKPR